MNNFIVKFYKLINDIYAQIGIVIVIIFLILIIFESYLPSPFEQNLDNRLSKIGENGYVLGSDQFGRDQLSRIIYGAKISITVGFKQYNYINNWFINWFYRWIIITGSQDNSAFFDENN